MSVRRLVAALGATLLLAGCGGDPEPKVEPTPSSPSTTMSASDKPASAEEFVNAWVRASNDMQVTGETTEYRELSAQCAPCLAVADHVDRVYKGGGHIETSGLTVRRTKFQGNASTKDVDLYGTSAVVRIVKPSGTSRLPGGPAHFLLSIKRVGSSWVATNLGLYES